MSEANCLQDLLFRSSSSRNYFFELPVHLQMQLHEHSPYIHSLHDLHKCVQYLKSMEDKKG
jgi:hypothetical protein